MDVAKIGLTNNNLFSRSNASSLMPTTQGNNSSSGEISFLSRSLYQSNIDLSGSTISFDGDITSFNLQFLHQTEQRVTLNGFLSQDQTSGKLSFSYKYSHPEVIKGTSNNRQFKMSFDLSFNNVQTISIEKNEKKEEILDFLQRINKEVFKNLNDKKINFTSIVLDPEDLQELSQLTDKKISQMIRLLIDMINSALKAKSLANKNKGAKNIIYSPKRITSDIKETAVNNQFKCDYSFSIKEIKEKEVTLHD